MDYVIPMAYTTSNEELAEQIDEWKTVDPALARIVPGLSIYRRSAEGSSTRDLDLIRSQHRLCEANGARGNVYFSLHYLNPPLIQVFQKEFYPEKKLAYHAPPRVDR